jgi:hypothetical protein
LKDIKEDILPKAKPWNMHEIYNRKPNSIPPLLPATKYGKKLVLFKRSTKLFNLKEQSQEI